MNWQSAPPHVYDLIFQHLNLEDSLSASEVCQEWNVAINRSAVFQRKAKFAISKYSIRESAVVIRSSVIDKSQRHYSNVVARGFNSIQWSQVKFYKMCRQLSVLNDRNPIKTFTLETPIGSWFLREYLLSIEGSLSEVEEFNLRMVGIFYETHSYNFELKLPELRRIRILQSPAMDMGYQTLQIDSQYLQYITICSNSTLGVIFNNPRARLKELCISIHANRNHMIRETMAIKEFRLDTLIIKCVRVDQWVGRFVLHMVPRLNPQRVIVHSAVQDNSSSVDSFIAGFTALTAGIVKLEITVGGETKCDCGSYLF
ncbi:uncharacterized protein LOC129758527 [Uranotaenia lowii]|uniref:uncharacterized protein LOC129758527 n=1 Tax=Uranotaenia lowii TaxID=190385 RepID=UPI00247899E8|nr:uncharacterized protein LOC129758527 [Uranotaenia lowii]